MMIRRARDHQTPHPHPPPQAEHKEADQENQGPQFPPEGWQLGAISGYDNRTDPATYTIITTQHGPLTYLGSPPAGEYFRRHCPVLYQTTPGTQDITEMKENSNNEVSHLFPGFKGVMGETNPTTNGGVIFPVHEDGTTSQRAHKYYQGTLNKGQGPLPVKGTPVFYWGHLSSNTSRKNLQGQSPVQAHYVDICKIEVDLATILAQDTSLLNPAVLNHIKGLFKIDFDLGAQAAGSCLTTISSLETAMHGNQNLLATLATLHEKAKKIDNDPNHKYHAQAHKLVRRFNSQHNKLNILINPRTYHGHNINANTWHDYITRELDHDFELRAKVNSIFLMEHSQPGTTTLNAIHHNPAITARPVTSIHNNFVHTVHVMTTPTYEGEWDRAEKKVLNCRASLHTTYLLHEFRSTTNTHPIPKITPLPPLPPQNQGVPIPDNMSDISAHDVTEMISVTHPTIFNIQNSYNQILKIVGNHGVYDIMDSPSHPGFLTYTLDAPRPSHPQILKEINNLQYPIFAMSEKEFNQGRNAHITLIAGPGAALSANFSVINSLLGPADQPATARLTASNSLTISSPFETDTIETLLHKHLEAVGPRLFPFRAMIVHDQQDSLIWLTSPSEKLPPKQRPPPSWGAPPPHPHPPQSIF
jgi:hypothetical protein